jgi:hypothetical protein
MLEAMTADQQFLDQLSAPLFWDVERSSVDPEGNAAFLIIRVMERGTSQEVRTTWAYYGPARIKDALLTAPSLSRKTIAFFANQFGLGKEHFRAYQRASHWHL